MRQASEIGATAVISRAGFADFRQNRVLRLRGKTESRLSSDRGNRLQPGPLAPAASPDLWGAVARCCDMAREDDSASIARDRLRAALAAKVEAPSATLAGRHDEAGAALESLVSECCDGPEEASQLLSELISEWAEASFPKADRPIPERQVLNTPEGP